MPIWQAARHHEPIPFRPPGHAPSAAPVGVHPGGLVRPRRLSERLVRAVDPAGGEPVGALAVDDEPEVFWDGADAAKRIDEWKTAVGWCPEWGTVGGAGGNGGSGRHVVDHVLEPLGVTAEQTCFTDCVPTYFLNGGRLAGEGDPGHL